MFVEPDPLPAIASIASVVAWLLVTAGVFFVRSPPRPPVGPRTLELGPEPPALANFLVHDFRVTAEAVPAITIRLTPNLGCVRWIVRAENEVGAGVG